MSDVGPVDLAACVERCGRAVEPAAAGIVVDTDRTILADESRLRQLLESLVRNAVEHAGDDVTVTVGALDDGFYVADDGPGIPAIDPETVSEEGHSSGIGATGFGFSIVEEIARAHDWSIDVTEGRDGGARFEINGVEFGQ